MAEFTWDKRTDASARQGDSTSQSDAAESTSPGPNHTRRRFIELALGSAAGVMIAGASPARVAAALTEQPSGSGVDDTSGGTRAPDHAGEGRGRPDDYDPATEGGGRGTDRGRRMCDGAPVPEEIATEESERRASMYRPSANGASHDEIVNERIGGGTP